MPDQTGFMTLTQATKIIPGRPSTNCLWRWCRNGVKARNGERVRLRHVRMGGRLYTKARWIDDFGDRLAEADAAYFDLEAEDAELVAATRPRRRTVPVARAMSPSPYTGVL